MSDFAQRHAQLLRFLAVGVSGVFVSMGVFQLLWSVLPHSTLANNAAATAGWATAVASNFVLHERWTFDHSDKNGTPLRRLARYYLSAAVGLGIQLVVMNAAVWVLREVPWPAPLGAWLLPWRAQLANLTGIATATIANWTLARRWVFR